MSPKEFSGLSPREQALACIAVLLDGNDAQSYLAFDGERGEELRRAAEELARLEPDVRMPFLGTMLRFALEQVEDRG